MLSEEEAAAALQAASGTGESIFLVRYSGGENGAPIEPVEIKPEGLSLAEYDISFAAGVTALRVEHRIDGPVKCRAEPAARKQVFAETPIELYTEEIDDETRAPLPTAPAPDPRGAATRRHLPSTRVELAHAGGGCCLAAPLSHPLRAHSAPTRTPPVARPQTTSCSSTSPTCATRWPSTCST